MSYRVSRLWSYLGGGGLVLVSLLVLWSCANARPPVAEIVPAEEGTTPVELGDAAAGRALFMGEVQIEGYIACSTCHTTAADANVLLGPNLAGVAERAASRVPGQSALEYLRRSIRIHDEYVVEGFQSGMVRTIVGKDFVELLNEQQLADLLAYLLTLDPAQARAALPHSTTPALPSSATAMRNPTATASATATLALSPSVAATATATARASPTAAASATLAPSPTAAASATLAPSPTAAASATLAPSPSAAASATVSASPTASPIASETPLPSATPVPTEAPSPLPVPTPSSIPTATPAPAAPTATPPIADDPGLAAYAGCINCHSQHVPEVVAMPHPVNPPCNTCHSGSPNRIGCPSCHSMHRIEAAHPVDPNLACNSCHQ